MNRIDRLFETKKKNILSVYMTAGFPELNDTEKVIKALQKGGADMIEIGMPFSDPLADGPVIQQSSQQALANGISIKVLFEQLKELRTDIHIPLVLMGYLNPVMQFGVDEFLEKCVECGIDGLIIPDLPLDIYLKEYQKKIEHSGLKFIMLITPQTSLERIKEIEASSGGFLYMVADSSTTGARSSISDQQVAYFKRIEGLQLSLPRLIGFGISNNETFSQACRYANGAIIGSAYIKVLNESNPGEIGEQTSAFIESLRSLPHS